MKLLDHEVDELAERGLTPLLPFYILKLRKAAKRAKTEEERRKVEEGFGELGLKLKEAIEGGLGRFSEEDIVTLLERLTRLVEYVGRGYRTEEVEKMINNSLKGYGQVLLERGVRRGVRIGKREGKLEGRQEGKLEGRQEGKLEGKLEDARNVLREGLSMEQAARITGIPADELLKQLNTPPQ